MGKKPEPRACAYCGKPDLAKPGGAMAFVNPHTKKAGYYHLQCFRKVCKEVK